MNRLMQPNKATAVFFVVLGLGCFCLSSLTQAVSPPPDGGYPGGNTAEGTDALLNTTGTGNTAIGYLALEKNTTAGSTRPRGPMRS
jgi:hypothetical protein